MKSQLGYKEASPSKKCDKWFQRGVSKCLDVEGVSAATLNNPKSQITGCRLVPWWCVNTFPTQRKAFGIVGPVKF